MLTTYERPRFRGAFHAHVSWFSWTAWLTYQAARCRLLTPAAIAGVVRSVGRGRGFTSGWGWVKLRPLFFSCDRTLIDLYVNTRRMAKASRRSRAHLQAEAAGW